MTKNDTQGYYGPPRTTRYGNEGIWTDAAHGQIFVDRNDVGFAHTYPIAAMSMAERMRFEERLGYPDLLPQMLIAFCARLRGMMARFR